MSDAVDAPARTLLPADATTFASEFSSAGTASRCISLNSSKGKASANSGTTSATSIEGGEEWGADRRF